MKRRSLLAGAAAVAALPRPSLAQGAGARTLKFIPEGNLANPDPIWTTTTVARNHGYMVYDTLFGVDSKLIPKPQMCDGYDLSDDKLTWTFKLRDGLKFHDGAPVRGVDCTASIARWAKRDAFGQRLLMVLDSMESKDDRSFTVKLKQPFPLLVSALAKPAANVCFIMPERVAKTDAFTQITDFTGSGPLRFLRNEWTPGSLASYAKFDGYVPRQEPPDFVAGGKVVNFDRIEWNIITDSATSAAAIQTGEEDWWQTPISDLLPQLRKMRGVTVKPMTSIGSIEVIRFNQLHPPFNNVKMRQAVLKVVNQKEYMQAAYGDDTSLYKTGVGVFTPGSPAESSVGMEAVDGPRDLAAAKKLVQEAGYKGEKIVIISPTDYPWLEAFCQVARDTLIKLGLNVDYQASDWGTVVQRRASKEPVEKGGWSIFCTGWEGLNTADPGGHYPILGNGLDAWFGWPTDAKMEQLRTDWFNAPDAAAQKKATDAIQALVWEDVPYVPLGQYFQPAAIRTNITGVLDSPFPIFWNAKKG
ncbi:ABC transporter substrate-binding protein [Acidisphaera sp. L21]|uniref:ABC transporter substrate-binding protein n=1 Tax=Acidisphaera sp. L21 TaxID=1641851 RepID=UPI00131BFE16|nr:ABC transporter substrate-binding protein [Acidisphaera sp. L21]